jgi:hypothetical protein
MSDVRLIDANALLCDVIGLTIVSPEVMNYANAVSVAIENAPTIDAVEVVRCRECKYARPLVQEEWVACIMWCRGSQSDGFCHMGAKMDGGAE